MRLFELFIGFRYLKSKKHQAFISFNTLLSVFIVMIGVFILVVVISVMNGFQAQIKDKILDVDSHITVNGFNGENNEDGIIHYEEAARKILTNPEVISAEPYFSGKGILRVNRRISAIIIRGIGDGNSIPPDYRRFIDEAQEGMENPQNSFSGPDAKEIFIGREMAEYNSIFIGDIVELIVPKGQFNAITGSTPGVERFTVAGYFKTGYYDFDTSLVFTSLPVAQKLFGIDDRVWGIGVKIKDIYKMDRVARELQELLGYEFQTITAEDKNQNLFYALKIERFIMTVILFLVIVSAGFTIMGTLVMVVMEKRKAIGILKSLGATQASIMTIFVLEGFFIGIIGAVSGLVLGIATAINLEEIILWIERMINAIGFWIYQTFNMGTWIDIAVVPTHVYYIDQLPAEIKPAFITFISVFAVFLATVSSIFPAWHASRLKPVETIRDE